MAKISNIFGTASMLLLAACSPASPTNQQEPQPEIIKKQEAPVLTKADDTPKSLNEWPKNLFLLCLEKTSPENKNQKQDANIENYDYSLQINQDSISIGPSNMSLGIELKKNYLNIYTMGKVFHGNFGPDGVIRENGMAYLKNYDEPIIKSSSNNSSLIDNWREGFFDELTGSQIIMVKSNSPAKGEDDYVYDTYALSLSGELHNNKPLKIDLECTHKHLSAKAQAIESARQAQAELAAAEREKMAKTREEFLIARIARNGPLCTPFISPLQDSVEYAKQTGNWSTFESLVNYSHKYDCLRLVE